MAARAVEHMASYASEASDRFDKVATLLAEDESNYKNMASYAKGTSETLGQAAKKLRGNTEPFEKLDNQVDSQCQRVTILGKVVSSEVMAFIYSPFFPYLLVTFALNIPPFAYGLAALSSEECNSSWLYFNAFLAVMHMGVAVYAVNRIKGGQSEKEQFLQKLVTQTEVNEGTPGDGGETPYVKVDQHIAMMSGLGHANSWQRIRMVMLHDMVMIIYYVLCLVWAIWQGIGTLRVVDDEVDAACGRWVVLSVLCGFLYMGLGTFSWFCSLCFLRYQSLQAQGGKEAASNEDPKIEEGGVKAEAIDQLEDFLVVAKSTSTDSCGLKANADDLNKPVTMKAARSLPTGPL